MKKNKLDFPFGTQLVKKDSKQLWGHITKDAKE